VARCLLGKRRPSVEQERASPERFQRPAVRAARGVDTKEEAGGEVVKRDRRAVRPPPRGLLDPDTGHVRSRHPVTTPKPC
jgi:hypothetical protein